MVRRRVGLYLLLIPMRPCSKYKDNFRAVFAEFRESFLGTLIHALLINPKRIVTPSTLHKKLKAMHSASKRKEALVDGVATLPSFIITHSTKCDLEPFKASRSYLEDKEINTLSYANNHGLVFNVREGNAAVTFY